MSKQARVASQARDTVAAATELAARFPSQVSTGDDVRRHHANALTWIEAELPDAVFWPSSAADVVEAVRIAIRHRAPLIAFGAGTSLEGHVNAPHGGISLDMSRMNRIVAVDAGDLDCTVEPGVRRGDLNRHLRDTGLFFSVDPGAEDATLGGMAATRASGTNSVRYGTMRDNVVRLCAVMADGRLVRTASKARKSAAGYDLTHLLVGSEGTLGIITELTVRLHPVPEQVVAAVAVFPDLAAACETAIACIAQGLGLARIELLDAAQIEAVNAHSGLALAERPTLFLELHGSPARIGADTEALRATAAEHGCLAFDDASVADRRRELWRARHDAFWAVKSRWPGKAILVTDVAVPLSRLAQCVAETAADRERSGLTGPIVGHVGDGNFHTILVFDAADARQRHAIEGFVDRLSERAVLLDGTCTGEHGIGQGKRSALGREMGEALDVMATIKSSLDPLDILNPGKILPRRQTGQPGSPQGTGPL